MAKKKTKQPVRVGDQPVHAAAVRHAVERRREHGGAGGGGGGCHCAARGRRRGRRHCPPRRRRWSGSDRPARAAATCDSLGRRRPAALRRTPRCRPGLAADVPTTATGVWSSCAATPSSPDVPDVMNGLSVPHDFRATWTCATRTGFPPSRTRNRSGRVRLTP